MSRYTMFTHPVRLAAVLIVSYTLVLAAIWWRP